MVPIFPEIPVEATRAAVEETLYGGQFVAQVPVQLLTPEESFEEVYNVIPFEAVKILPKEALLELFKTSTEFVLGEGLGLLVGLAEADGDGDTETETDGLSVAVGWTLVPTETVVVLRFAKKYQPPKITARTTTIVTIADVFICGKSVSSISSGYILFNTTIRFSL